MDLDIKSVNESAITVLEEEPNFFTLNNMDLSNISHEETIEDEHALITRQEVAHPTEMPSTSKNVCSTPKKKTLQCNECSYKTFFKSNLSRHVTSHHPEKECSICKKRYGTSFALKRHITTHEEQSYVCKICGKNFKSESGVRYHEKCHSGKGKECPVCKRKFYTKASYSGHLSQHTHEKPYKCGVCGAAFGYENNLVYHMKHTCKGEIAHPCKICGKSFTTKRNLKDHEKGKHTERTYTCHLCNKTYKWRGPLSYHLKNSH